MTESYCCLCTKVIVRNESVMAIFKSTYYQKCAISFPDVIPETRCVIMIVAGRQITF